MWKTSEWFHWLFAACLPAFSLAVKDAGWFTPFWTGPTATLLVLWDVNTFSFEVTVNLRTSFSHDISTCVFMSGGEKPNYNNNNNKAPFAIYILGVIYYLVLTSSHFVSGQALFLCTGTDWSTNRNWRLMPVYQAREILTRFHVNDL